MKAKPDANPDKQMPDDMYKKRFKAEEGKSYFWTCGALHLEQFSNDAIWLLKQYLLFSVLITILRKH